ncbi:MAG: HAMP domain-containing sensor histidine kinase [Novosphingobium sp.]
MLARGLADRDDHLLSADEPLAGLQLRCGGDLPGTIAIPALLEIVRNARRYGLKLARPITAQDGIESVTAWIEVQPAIDPEGSCAITVRSWRTGPLPQDDPDAAIRRRTEIDRTLAELTARLDARQCLLTVEGEAADLMTLVAAMRAGIGRPWTEYVKIEGDGHRQPMHWRLLDGAELRIEGSDRRWKAALVPIEAPGDEPGGFELYLVPEVPLAPAEQSAAMASSGDYRLIGTDLAPALRQPIARIIATAETIRARLAGPLDDAYSAYAADIASAGQHLLALIDDMADLAVVEAEGFSTTPDSIDLSDVARRAAGILGVRARERGIAINAPRAGATLPAVAEFRRVLQILLNLLNNAIRYTPENSQVWIRLERTGDRARVIVADQGEGLSAQAQARVFEKFERLGRSGDGGSGLGLYISRRLARAMGGDLTVESTPGQGARFILEVPLGA